MDHYPRASGDPNFSIQQLFSLVGVGPLPDDLQPFETERFAWQPAACSFGACNTLFRINSRERGVLREDHAGGAVTSLTRSAIEARLAAGSSATEALDLAGLLPLRVSVSVSQGISYSFLVDANQPLEVYGRNVSVAVLCPPDSVLVTNGATASLTGPADEMMLDTLIGVDIQAIDEPITQTLPHYTQQVAVASGAQAQIVVPERAVSAVITTAQTVASWTAWIGDPAILTNAAKQTQAITFTGGRAEIDIGNETALESDIVAADRLFTIRWNMQP